MKRTLARMIRLGFSRVILEPFRKVVLFESFISLSQRTGDPQNDFNRTMRN